MRRLLLLPIVGALLAALTGCIPLNGSVGSPLVGTRGLATAGDGAPMGAAATYGGTTNQGGYYLRNPQDTIGGGISP